MPIASLTLELHIEAAQSLKDRRQVVPEMLELLRLAEAGDLAIARAPEHHNIELMAGPKRSSIR